MERDYDQELNAIWKPIEAHERSACEAADVEYGALWVRLRKAWTFYRHLVERGTANNAPMGIRILYAKIANCLISILHLLQQGYPGPAVMVLRSMFEATINLRIILQADTAARSKLFEDFIHIEREYTFSMEGADETAKQLHIANLAAVRDKYHPQRPESWCWSIVLSKRKKKGVPNNPTMRELCEFIGQGEYYEQIYGRFSSVIHTVPSYESWIRREQGGPMELGPQFSSRIRSVGELAVALAVGSFVQVVNFLKPDDQNQLTLYVLQQTSK